MGITCQRSHQDRRRPRANCKIGKNRTEEPQALVIRILTQLGPSLIDAITFRTSAGPDSQSSQTSGKVCLGRWCSRFARAQTANQQGGRMLPFNGGKYDVYGPDTLEVMGAAFDTALELLPPDLQGHERARRKLALLPLGDTHGSWRVRKRTRSSGVARFLESHSIEAPGLSRRTSS
jgi:hypothetical protein